MAERTAGRSLTADQWHDWFTHQAGWTQETRRSLYRQAGLAEATSVLEVGCGTGAIVSELPALTGGAVFGLDIDPASLAFARGQAGGVGYIRGDAHALPFPAGSFDLVVCHYLLLWLTDPARGLAEMARVTRAGGFVLACAEPDYGARIDHPPELVPLGRLQANSLRSQGADPQLGRRLGELFAAAGLRATVGIVPGRWSFPRQPGVDFDAEWSMLEHDLAGLVSRAELGRLRSLDRKALADGRRLLFVPTFYAIGAKPAS